MRHRYRVDLSPRLGRPVAAEFKCGFVALLLRVGENSSESAKTLLRRKRTCESTEKKICHQILIFFYIIDFGS